MIAGGHFKSYQKYIYIELLEVPTTVVCCVLLAVGRMDGFVHINLLWSLREVSLSFIFIF